MILRLDDGSELRLDPEQVRDFSLLRGISELNACEELVFTGVDSSMVRDFFDLHRRLANRDNCDWFCQKVECAGNGYARDILSLNMYLGNESNNDRLYQLLEDLFKTMPDNVICHGFGLKTKMKNTS